jgi:hypothetical protein
LKAGASPSAISRKSSAKEPGKSFALFSPLFVLIRYRLLVLNLAAHARVIWFTRASCGPTGWKFNFLFKKKYIINCYNISFICFLFFYVMIFFKIIFVDFIFLNIELVENYKYNFPHKTLWIVTVFPSVFCFVLFFYVFVLFFFL